MRVLILNDRAHENAGALALLKSCCDGIDPPHELNWVNIHELNMQPCTKCNKCHPCGECILAEDDAHRIGRLIFSADALVIGLDSSLENLSATFRILLDRCTSAITFQNQQGKTCPWRKGRPAVVVSLEKMDNTVPVPGQRADRVHNTLLRALQLGGFKIIGSLAVPLRDHSLPEMLLISQARTIGCRLSGSLSYEAV